jgi:hypothetical protein
MCSHLDESCTLFRGEEGCTRKLVATFKLNVVTFRLKVATFRRKEGATAAFYIQMPGHGEEDQ